MFQIIIKESQLNSIKEKLRLEEELKMAQEKWETFSKKDKEFVFEFLKNAYPETSKTLKEATGWNTLGDIVGIFDPTGVVDLVNGISYIYQGDNLFGFLSIVSAVPYVGDVVAKPVMGALKLGAPSAKALETILKAAKVAKTPEELAKVSSELARLKSKGGVIGFFIQQFSKVSGKLKSIIERSPGGVLKGLKNTILQWINLFEKSSVAGKAIRGKAGKLAADFVRPASAVGKSLEIAKLSELVKAAKETPGLFTGYRTANKVLSWKNIFGGMPQLIGRNKSVRALMRKSKWWLGFLDYVGIGNFVGPDELLSKVGEEKMVSEMENYNKTEEAKKYAADEYGGAEISQDEVQSKSTQSSSQSSGGQDSNPLSDFFKSIFTNQVLKTGLAVV